MKVPLFFLIMAVQWSLVSSWWAQILWLFIPKPQLLLHLMRVLQLWWLRFKSQDWPWCSHNGCFKHPCWPCRGVPDPPYHAILVPVYFKYTPGISFCYGPPPVWSATLLFWWLWCACFSRCLVPISWLPTLLELNACCTTQSISAPHRGIHVNHDKDM